MTARNGDSVVISRHSRGVPTSRHAPGLLKTRAYEQLRRWILDNDLPPGSFLAERQLAKQLGMSKTPVKVALERLQQEGFVTISPQLGVVVRDLTVQEIEDQYELCEALESYTLRALAGRLTEPQIERVRASLLAQDAVRRSNDVQKWVALNSEFHLLFTEFLGNEEIRRISAQLRDRMQRMITRVLQLQPARLDSSYEEHVAIADAVISGDAARAAQLISAHLNVGRQLIVVPRGYRIA